MSTVARPRLVSVDVMRGATMAAMIVVNNPGSWAHMAPFLKHAAWGQWLTPADLVFPFFLFLVGVATPLALRRRLDGGAARGPLLVRAVRRAIVLAVIGFALNLFPQFELATVRIPGVLQRIAVVALGCAAAELFLRSRVLVGVVVGLLVGYTLILVAVPHPEAGRPLLSPDAHWPAWLDDRVFGAHTWRGPGDPEGVLSTLGALSTGLIGVLAGRILLARTTPAARGRSLVVAGAVAMGFGALAVLVVPVAKDVWTASYALLTAGAALLVLAGLEGWLGGRSERLAGMVRGAFEVFGRQALLAYVLAHLVSDVSIHVLRWSWADGTRSLHTLVHGDLLVPWLPPVIASLVYSLLVLAGVWALVGWLDRRGVRLRV
jgi:predicted acyltransferase